MKTKDIGSIALLLVAIDNKLIKESVEMKSPSILPRLELYPVTSSCSLIALS